MPGQKLSPEAGQAGLETGDGLDASKAPPAPADPVLAVSKRSDEEEVVIEDVGERAVLHLELDSPDARVVRVGDERRLHGLEAIGRQHHVIVEKDDDVGFSGADADIPRRRDASDRAVVHVCASLPQLRAHRFFRERMRLATLALVDHDELVGKTRLLEDAREQLLEVLRPLTRGHDDGNQHAAA